MQFIDLECLLSTASITSGISSRTSSHPPVFVPWGSAVHSRCHAVDGVITIDFACCLDSSSDPVIEPMLQSIPDSFDPYGPPQVEDRIFSILQLLSINTNTGIQLFTKNVKPAGGILSPLFIAQHSKWDLQLSHAYCKLDIVIFPWCQCPPLAPSRLCYRDVQMYPV